MATASIDMPLDRETELYLQDLWLRVESDLCPHSPSMKQAEFLMLPHREAFYGGAAGGGKSDALLMAALQYVDITGYAALLLRRTYADLSLPGSLMTRAEEWLSGTSAHWNDKTKTWTFPSGATITFGYLENRSDHFRYKGAEFQFIGFDELTQFPEVQYRFLFSRLRKLEGVDIPLRMRSASNPGDVGHAWVKQRFIVEGDARGRPFIPAKIEDNPHLDREEYIKSLEQLDPHTRQQLRDGDWDVMPDGNKFKRAWFKIIPKAPEGLRFVRYWDLAATEPKPGRDPDYTVGVKMGVNKAGEYYVENVKRERMTPRGVERLIRSTAEVDGTDCQIAMEQEPGSAGKHTTDHYNRIVLPEFDFKAIKTTGSKELRCNPWSAKLESGLVYLIEGEWCGEFIDEHCAFPGGSHDDQPDAASGAFAICAKMVKQMNATGRQADFSGVGAFA